MCGWKRHLTLAQTSFAPSCGSSWPSLPAHAHSLMSATNASHTWVGDFHYLPSLSLLSRTQPCSHPLPSVPPQLWPLSLEKPPLHRPRIHHFIPVSTVIFFVLVLLEPTYRSSLSYPTSNSLETRLSGWAWSPRSLPEIWRSTLPGKPRQPHFSKIQREEQKQRMEHQPNKDKT